MSENKADPLREALKPLAAISLWRDKYQDGPDMLTNDKLARYFTADQVRAARAALAAPQPAAPSKLASSERLGPLYDGTRSITRSLTPDGGGVTTPSRRAPLSFSYKDHRGEISMKTVSPVSVRFGLTDSYQEPQWLMLALDHDMNAGCEFVMADMSQPAAPLGGRDEIARRLALEIADRYEAGAERCAASGYEEFGEAFQAERKIIVSALRRYAAIPQERGVDRAAIIDECALRLDEIAAYEDWHIEAIKQDHGLSETGRESLIEHAVTRRTAFRQGASSIRHLRALAGKETGR